MTCESGRECFFVFFLLNAFFWSEPCFHHASPSPFVTGWVGGWKELWGGEPSDGDRWGGREREKKKTLQFPPPRQSAGAAWEQTRTADALGKNKSHMEKKWKCFNGRRAGRSVLTAAAFAAGGVEHTSPFLFLIYLNKSNLSGHGAEMQPCVIIKVGSGGGGD